MMALVERLRWRASHVSAKRTASEFERVLNVDSLGGGSWKVLDQRAWKTGQSSADEPWALRARQAKLITVWRSFEQSSPSRWLWVQVTPLASPSDADAALHVIPDRLLANARAEVKVVSAHDVKPFSVSGHLVGWAHEQKTSGPTGAGVALHMALVIGSTLAVLAASGDTDSWTWDELRRIASSQAELL